MIVYKTKTMKKLLYLIVLLFAFNINAQQIIYKVKDAKIISISRQSNDYILKSNEYSSVTWYQKPFFNGNVVIESITQIEIDAKIEYQSEQDLITQIKKELTDGIEASEKLVLYIQQLGLKPDQLLTAKKVLLPVYKALRDGNWDIAQEEMNLINRPSGAFGVVYDTIKNRIDSYLGIE